MLRLFVLTVFICLAGPVWAAGDRFALIIGNNNYTNFRAEEQLVTAINDAEAMAAALTKIGFAVTLVTDGTKLEILRALNRFEGTLTPDATALLFYAGHGVEVDGANYLLPSDVPRLAPMEKYLVSASAIALDDVLSILGRARASVIILDACRNDPFEEAAAREKAARGAAAGTISRGLAGVNTEPSGTVII